MSQIDESRRLLAHIVAVLGGIDKAAEKLGLSDRVVSH
jgi:hypothetical protein